MRATGIAHEQPATLPGSVRLGILEWMAHLAEDAAVLVPLINLADGLRHGGGVQGAALLALKSLLQHAGRQSICAGSHDTLQDGIWCHLRQMLNIKV